MFGYRKFKYGVFLYLWLCSSMCMSVFDDCGHICACMCCGCINVCACMWLCLWLCLCLCKYVSVVVVMSCMCLLLWLCSFLCICDALPQKVHKVFFWHFEVWQKWKLEKKIFNLIHISLKSVILNGSYGILKLMRCGSSISRKTRLKISAWMMRESP